MTAGELSRALAAQAERIARELLPNGKQQQGEWVVGNVQGDPGKSTSICIRGEKAGVWEDFATGEHGDLLDLIRATSGKDMKQACDQARAMLGLSDSMPLQSPKREYKTPPKPKCQAPKSAVKEYLNGRGMSDTELFDWIEEETCDLRVKSHAIADTGDHDLTWVVVQHHMSDPREREIGYGNTAREAVQDAMKGPDDPSKWDYIPPEYR